MQIQKLYYSLTLKNKPEQCHGHNLKSSMQEHQKEAKEKKSVINTTD